MDNTMQPWIPHFFAIFPEKKCYKYFNIHWAWHFQLTSHVNLKLIGHNVRERTSNGMDFRMGRLQNPTTNVKTTFLKDTTDLLQHLAKIKPTANTRIISLDVTSLYTNIPQRLGINSICTVGAALDPGADYTIVADLAQLVLENNIFKFNGDHYIQTQGTAMGTRMAPAYANIFMYTIEEKIIEQLPEITLWRRLIDDIICIFERNEICDAQYILEVANDIIPEIQFTMETLNGMGVHFLDTTLTITEEEIISAPYIKPTDKRLYVRMDSCHPLYQKMSIAYSQCLRLRRICSSTDTYLTYADKLRTAMINEDTPHHLLTKRLKP